MRDAHAAGIAVVPVPGPSAVTAALSVCGLRPAASLFVGFLPHEVRTPPHEKRWRATRGRAADPGVLRVARCGSLARSRT